LIGAGAVGSAFAELLVRGGVHRLLVLDSEGVQVGNLTRHSLTMEHVGTPKALGLATRLNKISPHATVLGHKSEFPPTDAVIEAPQGRAKGMEEPASAASGFSPYSRATTTFGLRRDLLRGESCMKSAR
jgi:ThiF family